MVKAEILSHFVAGKFACMRELKDTKNCVLENELVIAGVAWQ